MHGVVFDGSCVRDCAVGFTDGTRGIFVTSIPEPGALLLVSLMLPLWRRCRNRGRLGPRVGL